MNWTTPSETTARSFGSVPRRSSVYHDRGVAWADKGELDKAIKDYTEAIRLDPDFAKAYNNRGHAWQGKGEDNRAKSDFAEASARSLDRPNGESLNPVRQSEAVDLLRREQAKLKN